MILRPAWRLFCEWCKKALRIDLSIRYNANNGQHMPNKTVRTGAGTSYTHLTQPTELAEDWAGMDFIIPDLSRPGGIPSGRSAFAEPDCGLSARLPLEEL